MSAWELETGRHLSFAIATLARLATVKGPPTRDFHVDLKLSWLYDFMTELCRLKAEAIKKIIRIQTFTALDKGKSRSEIGGFILTAGKVTTGTWQRLSLCLEGKVS
jgi:hypothetical protein